jgi:methionine synthase II (cobalamin-independent)
LATHSRRLLPRLLVRSDFNAIFANIARLDADVISIEASKSDLKLLEVFKTYQYPNASSSPFSLPLLVAVS